MNWVASSAIFEDKNLYSLSPIPTVDRACIRLLPRSKVAVQVLITVCILSETDVMINKKLHVSEQSSGELTVFSNLGSNEGYTGYDRTCEMELWIKSPYS